MVSKQLLSHRTRSLSGRVKAPASKSYTQRVLEVASLDKHVMVRNPLICDDTEAAKRTWQNLGASIEQRYVDGVPCFGISGFDGRPEPKSPELNVGESGTLLRFVLPVLALASGPYVVKGEGTLRSRPNGTIVKPLQDWGIEIAGQGPDETVPIRISARGEIPGGIARVDGRVSSQTVSSLLLAAPRATEQRVSIELTSPLVSRKYVDIAIDVLREFGVEVEKAEDYRTFIIENQRLKSPKEYVVHGDYSSAAFLIAAACLLESDVVIEDLVTDEQGDSRFLEFMERMGANIGRGQDCVHIQGPFDLRGIGPVDCGDTPDIVPILATMACFAKGTTCIQNISHLAYKESNRIKTTAEELNRLGGKVKATNSELIISGSGSLSADGQVFSSHEDHRIAMSLAVAGLASGPLLIDGYECHTKSYPGFVQDLQSLGADLSVAE